MPAPSGASSFPVPGFRVEIVDEHSHDVHPLAEGNIVVELPLPPGTVTTLWKGDDRYVVLTSGSNPDEAELAAEFVAMVRDQIGAVAAFRHVVVVSALPKTRYRRRQGSSGSQPRPRKPRALGTAPARGSVDTFQPIRRVHSRLSRLASCASRGISRSCRR
jgi:hypothetical protein